MVPISEKFDSSLSAPRAPKREARPSSDIEFVGFTPEQVVWIKKFLEYTRLPLGRIKTISFVSDAELQPSETDEEGIYGAESPAAVYKPIEQGIFLNKDYFLSIPEPARAYALRSTLIHEAAHSFHPLKAYWENRKTEAGEDVDEWMRGFADQYLNQHRIELTLNALIDVSNQLLTTKVYVDGYSRFLLEKLTNLEARFQKGEVDEDVLLLNQWRLVTEIHAILIELLFTNPMHLAIVDESCRKKHSVLPEPRAPYVSILETAYKAYEAVTGLGYAETAGAIARSMLHARTSPF